MQLRRDVREAIAAHVRRDAPRECCGLLIGTDCEVLEAVPAANAAADPLRQYEVSPAEYLAQIRRCRGRRAHDGLPLGVVGVYHSHPQSAPAPSPTDVEQAFGEFLYLIAGPANEALEIRAYRFEAGRFTPVPLEEGPDPTC